MPVFGSFVPATRAKSEPRFAPPVALPTTGLMSWLASPVRKLRTMASLSARPASRVKVLPKVIPGIAVGISPVTLRTPAGASILGSNVSIWPGLPCWQRKMTLLPVTGRAAALAPRACAASRLASDSPPSPKLPIRRKSRRASTPRASRIRSMAGSIVVSWREQARRSACRVHFARQRATYQARLIETLVLSVDPRYPRFLCSAKFRPAAECLATLRGRPVSLFQIWPPETLFDRRRAGAETDSAATGRKRRPWQDLPLLLRAGLLGGLLGGLLLLGCH